MQLRGARQMHADSGVALFQRCPDPSQGELRCNRGYCRFPDPSQVELMYNCLYQEWLHRQCVGLAHPWTRVLAPVAAASLAICRPRRAIRGAQGILPMMVGGATSQMVLPSLTPLSVASCGRLQLGVPHWAAPVDFDHTFCGSRFSTRRLLAIEGFTSFTGVSFVIPTLVTLRLSHGGTGVSVVATTLVKVIYCVTWLIVVARPSSW